MFRRSDLVVLGLKFLSKVSFIIVMEASLLADPCRAFLALLAFFLRSRDLFPSGFTKLVVDVSAQSVVISPLLDPRTPGLITDPNTGDLLLVVEFETDFSCSSTRCPFFFTAAGVRPDLVPILFDDVGFGVILVSFFSLRP